MNAEDNDMYDPQSKIKETYKHTYKQTNLIPIHILILYIHL